MARDIKRLGKETLIYGTSTVLARLLNFCLVPFYTYYLQPTQYGAIATVFAAIALLSVVFLFGLDQSYLRFASEATDKHKVFRQCFYGVLANALVLGGLLYVFAPQVSLWWGLGENFGPFRLAAAILFLDVLNMIAFTKLRLERRAWYFAGVRAFSIVINVVLNVVFLAVLHRGPNSILWANIGASLASLLVLAPVWGSELKGHNPFAFDWNLQKEMARFAWPFVPAGVASLLVSVIDKPILVHLVGTEQVGIYQANFKIGVFMMLLVSMFDQAWRPFFLAHANDSDAKDTFSKVFSFFFALGSWFVLGISFLMPDIITGHLFGNFHLIGPNYWGGLKIIPLIVTGYFFYGLYINFMVAPVLTKKTRVLMWITLLGAAVSITTNLTLVPHIGILGAGWAVALSYAAMAGALFAFTQKVYPIAYEYKKIGYMGLVCLATVLAARYFNHSVWSEVILLTLYPLWMWLILKRGR